MRYALVRLRLGKDGSISAVEPPQDDHIFDTVYDADQARQHLVNTQVGIYHVVEYDE